MSESVYLITISSVLVTVIIVFALRYLALSRQTRSRLANEDTYRELASRSASALADASARLGSVNAEVGLLGVRLAAIERILKEVE